MAIAPVFGVVVVAVLRYFAISIQPCFYFMFCFICFVCASVACNNQSALGSLCVLLPMLVATSSARISSLSPCHVSLHTRSCCLNHCLALPALVCCYFPRLQRVPDLRSFLFMLTERRDARSIFEHLAFLITFPLIRMQLILYLLQTSLSTAIFNFFYYIPLLSFSPPIFVPYF